MNTNSLNYFKKQGIFTNLDEHKKTISKLPTDIKILTQVIQGVMLHDGFTKEYGLKHKAGLYHYVGDILDQVVENDSRPITFFRPPDKRVQVCCRDYAVLLTALLREKNISARARCGFAKFGINEKRWFDHWICEYWHKKSNKWIKVDAQLDPHLQKILKIKYDPLVVPDNLFLTASKAWLLWRRKKVNPKLFTTNDLCGSWLIRGNLLRDFAALNKVEIEPYMMRINLELTWKPWRLMTTKDSKLTDNDWELLDNISDLTQDVDSNLEEIISLYQQNDELKPPANLYERIN